MRTDLIAGKPSLGLPLPVGMVREESVAGCSAILRYLEQSHGAICVCISSIHCTWHNRGSHESTKCVPCKRCQILNGMTGKLFLPWITIGVFRHRQHKRPIRAPIFLHLRLNHAIINLILSFQGDRFNPQSLLALTYFTVLRVANLVCWLSQFLSILR